MLQSVLTTAAVLAVVSLSAVEAHSKMSVPAPNSPINDSPSGFIDGYSALQVPAGRSFSWGPDHNTESFHMAFDAQTKYKTVRDLIYANFQASGASTKECGQSAATGTPQALPAYVEYEWGFTVSHEGPCEVWCDNTRVFYEKNCAVKYPGKPAKLPYDKAKCAGAKRLQSFWLALHEPKWQAYISCASLTGQRLLRSE